MKKVLFAICVFVFTSCGDDLKDKQVRVNIKVENNCGRYATLIDSIDIVMEFIDKDGKMLVEADVITKSPADDTNFHFRMRLKDSDKWRIKGVQGKFGGSPCLGCIDSTDLGPCKIFITSKNDFVPVDSAAIFRAICSCRL